MPLGYMVLMASSKSRMTLHQNYCNASYGTCDGKHSAATTTQKLLKCPLARAFSRQASIRLHSDELNNDAVYLDPPCVGKRRRLRALAAAGEWEALGD